MTGFLYGLLRGPDADYSGWRGFAVTHAIVDLASFVRVACIHNASYLGGFLGLIAALLHLRRLKQATAPVIRLPRCEPSLG